MSPAINKQVLIIEGIKMLIAVVRSGGTAVGRRALDEMEKTTPRFTDSAPRGGPSEGRQPRHRLETVGSTPTLANKTEYSGPSQISAAGKACIPCGNDHFSTAAGALTESIRFAQSGGIDHPEVASRITAAIDELNIFERIDGAPEKVTKLPATEKDLMTAMMAASRSLRHHITDVKTVDDLERTAVLARQNRIEFMAKQLKLQKGT